MNQNLDDLYKYVNKYINSKKKILIGDKNLQLNSSSLKKKINNIANNLYKLKLKNNHKIGIFIDRNVDYIACIFACWKIGALPVPLNNKWTFNHLNEIQKIIDFDLIISSEKLKTIGSNNKTLKELLRYHKIINNDLNFQISRKKNINAYIIFTSGSTGNQKAVLITAKGYIDYIKWTKKEFNKFKNLKSLLITAELTFDITMGDIAFALSFGTSIVISSDSKNIFEHLFLIKKYKIQVFYSVPNTINLLLDYSMMNNSIKSLKLILSGGDSFTNNMIKKMFEILDDFAFYNVYGPTECTINVTSIRLDKLFKKNNDLEIPIGKVFKHLEYKLLNKTTNKFNKNKGELIISGSQVMEGYLEKEKIIKPFINIGRKFYYKTGDLVEVKDGNIYIIGRNDNLVKIKGYRINPIEIDNLSNTIKEIKQSKTIVIKDVDEVFLVQFILLNKTNIKLDEIKEKLKKILSYYMIPKHLIKINKFPVGLSGKVDNAKLKNLFNAQNR